jgi:hypothetical protein
VCRRLPPSGCAASHEADQGRRRPSREQHGFIHSVDRPATLRQSATGRRAYRWVANGKLLRCCRVPAGAMWSRRVESA